MMNSNWPANEVNDIFYKLALEVKWFIINHIFLGQNEEITSNEWIIHNLLLGSHETHATYGDSFITLKKDVLESVVNLILLEASLKRKDESRMWVHFKLCDNNLNEFFDVVKESEWENIHEFIYHSGNAFHEFFELGEFHQDLFQMRPNLSENRLQRR